MDTGRSPQTRAEGAGDIPTPDPVAGFIPGAVATP